MISTSDTSATRMKPMHRAAALLATAVASLAIQPAGASPASLVVTAHQCDDPRVVRHSEIDCEWSESVVREPTTDPSRVPGQPTETDNDNKTRMLEVLHVLDGTSDVSAVAFSANGQWCATGGLDGQVSVWEISTGKLLTTFEPGLEDRLQVETLRKHFPADRIERRGGFIRSIAFADHDGLLIVTDGDRMPHAWNWRREERMWPAPSDSSPWLHSGSQYWLSIAPDRSWIAVVPGTELLDSGFFTWKLAGKPSRRVVRTDPLGPVFRVAASPNGTTVAAIHRHGSLALWSVSDETTYRTLVRSSNFAAEQSPTGHLEFSPSGKSLLVVLPLATGFSLWDMDRYEQVLELDQRVIRSAAMLGNGSAVAVAVSEQVDVWDLSSGEVVATGRVLDPTCIAAHQSKGLLIVGHGTAVTLFRVP